MSDVSISELNDLLTSSTGPAETMTFYEGEVTLHYNDTIHAYYRQEGREKFLIPSVTQVVSQIDKSGPLMQWAANMSASYVRAGVSPYTMVSPEPEGQGAMVIIDAGVLEEMLVKSRLHFRSVSKEATDIGNIAHEWLKRHLHGIIAGNPHDEALPDDDNARASVEAALDWMARHSFRPLASEKKIYSREMDVSGTFDWLAHISSCDDPKCCATVFTSKLAIGDFKTSKALYDEYRIQVAAYKKARMEEFPLSLIDLRVILRLDKEGGGFEAIIMDTDPTEDEYAGDLSAFMGALDIFRWQKQRQVDNKYKRDMDRRAKRAAKAAETARIKAEKAAERAAKGLAPRKPRKRSITIQDVPPDVLPEGSGALVNADAIPVEA